MTTHFRWNTPVNVRFCVCVRIFACVCVFAFVSVCTCVCAYVCVCMLMWDIYVSMYVRVCIEKNISCGLSLFQLFLPFFFGLAFCEVDSQSSRIWYILLFLLRLLSVTFGNVRCFPQKNVRSGTKSHALTPGTRMKMMLLSLWRKYLVLLILKWMKIVLKFPIKSNWKKAWKKEPSKTQGENDKSGRKEEKSV